MTRLDELEAAITDLAAQREALTARRQRATDQLHRGGIHQKQYDPAARAGLRVELEDLDAALEAIADREAEASRELAPLVQRRAQIQRQQAEDDALLASVGSLFQNPAAFDRNIPADLIGPIGSFHRQVLEAAERRRADGVPIPDEVTITMPLTGLVALRPWHNPNLDPDPPMPAGRTGVGALEDESEEVEDVV